MGETRVDLLHLLEDLADAYPGDLDETILTEIVANSLDSGASHIAFDIYAATSMFTAIDNGEGMRRADLRRFHDIAATSKTRGEGIGFAGVGIKLGLLVSDVVVTETRRADLRRIPDPNAKRLLDSSRHIRVRHSPYDFVRPRKSIPTTQMALRAATPFAQSRDGGGWLVRRHDDAALLRSARNVGRAGGHGGNPEAERERLGVRN